MVVALVFAGGTGQRMSSRSKPKQFLELHGKPIIVYTLEHFEYHEMIDQILVVCLDGWQEELGGLIKRYGLSKVKHIVTGGATGHDSIYNGLDYLRGECKDEDIVLIHDGVRPLISKELITENIDAVKQYGNAITAETTRESVLQSKDGKTVASVPARDEMFIAKAPQSFKFKDIMELYDLAKNNGHKSIDSAHLLSMYDRTIHLVHSPKNNIKITDPADYYIFRALYEATENQQIMGI